MRHKGEQTGSVRLKNGVYTVRFYEWRMKDGRLQYLQTERTLGKKSDFPSKKAAELHAYAQYVQPANTQKAAAHGVYTVEAFVDQRYSPDIVDHHAKSWTDATYSILRRHILPRFGALRLEDVRRVDVQDWVNGMKGKLAPQTIRHCQKILHQIFRHATRLEVFHSANPAEDLILPKLVYEERTALTMDQVRQLAAVLPEQYGRVALLLTHTGMRIGECLGLRWRSVDFEAGTIRVDEQFTAGELKDQTKTAAGRRVIPMTEESRRVLMDELRGSRWTGEDHWVFSNRNGRPLNSKNILQRFLAPAAEKLGFGAVVWHTFRHTTATLIDRYATAAEKQALLGHTSAAMSNRYTHASVEQIRKSLELATGVVQ